MHFAKEVRDKVLIIEIHGSFRVDNVDDFEEFVKPYLRTAKNFAFNLKELEMIDSSGIGAILQVYKALKTRTKEGEIYLYNLNKVISMIFSSAKLNQFFIITNQEEIDSLFPSYEKKEEKFEIYSPPGEIRTDTNFKIRKISTGDLLRIYKKNSDIKLFLEEDCTLVKQGRELNQTEISIFNKKGYEYLWVTTNYKEPEEDSNEEFIEECREQLNKILLDMLFEIHEKDFNKKNLKVEYLSGTDLFSPNLDQLQNDGAILLHNALFSDSGKIEQIKIIFDKFVQHRIKRIGLFDNRSYGTHDMYKIQGAKRDKSSDEFLNTIVKHSVNTALIFLVIASNIRNERALRGAQTSTMKYEKEIEFDKNKRVLYSADYIFDAGLGALFHDLGYAHAEMRKIVFEQLENLKDSDFNIISDFATSVDAEKKKYYQRHPYIASNILSAVIDSKVNNPLGNNIVKYHHCLLDGSGYPERKEYIEDGKPTFRKPIHEFTRLFTIIDLIDEMTTRKPWRLPLSRSFLIDYLLKNVVPSITPDGQPDKDGMFDINTLKKHTAKFDPIMLDFVLRSIHLYKIDELVIVTNSETKKQIPAVIHKYSDYAHRPIVKVNLNGKEGLMDLSKEKFKKFYIDEVFHCIQTEED